MSVELAEGIAQRLEDQGLATWQATGVYDPSVAWPIYVDATPQESRAAIVLSPYGTPDEPDSARPYDDGRLQIRVRGDADPRTARNKLKAIFNDLHGLGPVTLTGGFYLQSLRSLSSTPSPMGQDSSRRWEFVQNYEWSTVNLTAHRSA